MRIELRNGRPPVSQEIREHALGLSPEAMEAAGMVTEEIATLRLLLRNVNRRAMQGIDTREYLRLVDLYSLGCVRLARMLKIGGCDENERLMRYLQNMIDDALRYLTLELGLDKEVIDHPRLSDRAIGDRFRRERIPPYRNYVPGKADKSSR